MKSDGWHTFLAIVSGYALYMFFIWIFCKVMWLTMKMEVLGNHDYSFLLDDDTNQHIIVAVGIFEKFLIFPEEPSQTPTVLRLALGNPGSDGAPRSARRPGAGRTLATAMGASQIPFKGYIEIFHEISGNFKKFPEICRTKYISKQNHEFASTFLRSL